MTVASNEDKAVDDEEPAKPALASSSPVAMADEAEDDGASSIGADGKKKRKKRNKKKKRKTGTGIGADSISEVSMND